MAIPFPPYSVMTSNAFVWFTVSSLGRFSVESLEWLFRPSLNRNEENSSQNLLQTFSANAFKIASFITTIHFQVSRFFF
ncbi:hypothetical protein CXB51_006625 [Gossypium anomalum]|uniref:Uncharacterized protein n=1 Tax=Gossypium anomalum TaxID=47600 RepID=A0A8J5Z3S1_9ROSI|nr:hypothetical protein CXB51_006625 [Gossypium anomalum]